MSFLTYVIAVIVWMFVGCILSLSYAFLSGASYQWMLNSFMPFFSPLILFILCWSYIWPNWSLPGTGMPKKVKEKSLIKKIIKKLTNQKLFFVSITALFLPIAVNGANEIAKLFDFQVVPFLFENRFYLIIITFLVAYFNLVIKLFSLLIYFPKKYAIKLWNMSVKKIRGILKKNHKEKS